MEIWPAIDLRGGKCVRLRQGDYRQETVFGDDPAAMARHWVDLGAKCLHLVDLDGAREGRPVHLASVRSIVEATKGVSCELGGGIRNGRNEGRRGVAGNCFGGNNNQKTETQPSLSRKGDEMSKGETLCPLNGTSCAAGPFEPR